MKYPGNCRTDLRQIHIFLVPRSVEFEGQGQRSLNMPEFALFSTLLSF